LTRGALVAQRVCWVWGGALLTRPPTPPCPARGRLGVRGLPTPICYTTCSWRSSAASVSPRLSWDTAALEPRSSSPMSDRWPRPRSCCSVVTGQGPGCVDAGHFSVDRYRAAGARPHFVTPGIPALTLAELLQSRKNVPRSESTAKTIQHLHNRLLGYTKWCEERGRRQYWTAKFATSCCRNLGVSCVSAPS
jgi:hypothetical protein